MAESERSLQVMVVPTAWVTGYGVARIRGAKPELMAMAPRKRGQSFLRDAMWFRYTPG